MNGRISYGWLVDALESDGVKIGVYFLTYPAPNVSWLICKDRVIAAPEGSAEAGQASREPNNDTERDKIAQGLCLKKTWKGIPLHSLEDVIFGIVEDFWIVSSLFFNRVDNFIQNRFWKDDFSLRAR